MHQLQVPDMSCAACVRRVTRAVQTVDPGAQVDADLASRAVKIDSTADVSALKEALAAAGYPAGPGTL
ncbi:heavy-metal-associated domain-containing protein [Rubellimicrobium arenae]|uniref:heavy-metal-associated domain-containing protein n=1 Tax=Rubellimicrobium arenae TaxID=2817372 RepID=UPI001B315AF2|nr:heavy-metal-associated domain-containing protein [Rubellimicrobium arenae]